MYFLKVLLSYDNAVRILMEYNNTVRELTKENMCYEHQCQ